MVTLACGVAAYYLHNPVWMIFCITTILISVAIRWCVFISFVSKYITFRAAPELTAKNEEISAKNSELLKKIAEMEPRFKKLIEGENK